MHKAPTRATTTPSRQLRGLRLGNVKQNNPKPAQATPAALAGLKIGAWTRIGLSETSACQAQSAKRPTAHTPSASTLAVSRETRTPWELGGFSWGWDNARVAKTMIRLVA